MKKTIYSILFVASVLASSSCMKVDNFDAPEAHVTGRIIDSTTGENILADQGECRVRIWEKSFSLNPANQDIPVKQDIIIQNYFPEHTMSFRKEPGGLAILSVSGLERKR